MQVDTKSLVGKERAFAAMLAIVAAIVAAMFAIVAAIAARLDPRLDPRLGRATVPLCLAVASKGACAAGAIAA